MTGSIVFVNGTGVRLKGYKTNFDQIRRQCVAAGITADLLDCAWGDPFGVIFEGRSLPDSTTDQKEAIELARWRWLFDDPLFELDKLTIRVSLAGAPLPPGKMSAWQVQWDRIAGYKPSPELQQLLQRGGLRDDWDKAWAEIALVSPIPKLAFQRSGEAGEPVEAPKALARAMIARMHVMATDAGRRGPAGELRKRMLERLYEDWQCNIAGPGQFLINLFSRAATTLIRRNRNRINEMISLPIGDILLYQSRGVEIRDFIRHKIEEAPGPVTLVAHSLGGIACVDMLAETPVSKIKCLVTVGSQSSYFYEIDALWSIKAPASIPGNFPPWLNVYDRDDFLSFVAAPLFPGRVTDREVRSGLPFPDSHGAYFTNPDVWNAIRAQIEA
ncbi:hypothetical protein [Candidatus Phyllobacterium onerii]|uniref:hypothetical protein n=1 Tax=Candidatus Phyllobacterium onerii TaxID=3020828 RepID=UPI00232E813B|nr:hypothetical protein [Phyllobacterium sp. IY22]